MQAYVKLYIAPFSVLQESLGIEKYGSTTSSGITLFDISICIDVALHK